VGLLGRALRSSCRVGQVGPCRTKELGLEIGPGKGFGDFGAFEAAAMPLA